MNSDSGLAQQISGKCDAAPKLAMSEHASEIRSSTAMTNCDIRSTLRQCRSCRNHALQRRCSSIVKYSPTFPTLCTSMPVFQLYFGYFLVACWMMLLCGSLTAADFIDKVECEKDKMVVYINEAKVQEDYPAIGVDRYSVYVHQFKETCHDQGIVSQSNSLKSKRFVVPLNAGCGINSQADNTMGIHKEWLVYQATVRLEAIKPRSPDGRILEQRVKCVYSTSHQATASSNRLLVKGPDSNAVATSRQSSPILGAGTVEGSAPPIENFIELCFASADPKFSPLQEATIGDAVRIVLRMSHNVAYSAMKPEFCIISNKPYANRNDPDFRELIIVNAGCSVQSTPPLIPKMVYRASLTVGEPEMYYSKFTMFKMGDYNELHAMCNVKLCISSSEKACDTTQPRGCFESVRRRKKRSPDRWAAAGNGTHTLPNSETLPTLSPMAAALQRHRAASHYNREHSHTARNSLALVLPTTASSASDSTPATIRIPLLINSNNNAERLRDNSNNEQYALTSTPSTAASDATTTLTSFTTTGAAYNKPFNPDLLTVSGRLHVNRQNVADSAALTGSQLCFNSVTFSILAAVLAWVFILSFCCVVLLALLLRRQKRKQLDNKEIKSTENRTNYSSNSSTDSSSSPPCRRRRRSVDDRRPIDARENSGIIKTVEHQYNPHGLSGGGGQANLKTGTLMYSVPQHHTTRLQHQYHHPSGYCSSSGEGGASAQKDQNPTMMMKLRHYASHQPSLLRHHRSFTAVASATNNSSSRVVDSPGLATTITMARHRQRHHTLRPTTTTKSASSSYASSASSTSSALSPSPLFNMSKAGKLNNNSSNVIRDSSSYDVLGPQKLDY